MGILKIIEAHEEGPQYYEDRWEEHTDWWNGSYVALSDCGEIWNLQEDEQYNEKLDKDLEGWRAERYVNPLCENKKNIWLMQIGCRSTFQYTDLYPTKKELITNLKKGNFNWQAFLYGTEPCEPRGIEFEGKIFYPPNYK